MDITSNPLVVTAADVAAAAVTVWLYVIHVKQIIFTQYIAPGDSATINQINGKQFAYLSGAGDLSDRYTNNIEFSRGLVVPKGGITNGEIRIYIR